MRAELHDGRILEFPDGTDPAVVQATVKKVLGSTQTEQPSFMDQAKQQAGNLVAGAVRGAGSIGATILAPIDIVKDAIDGKGLSLESNRQRRSDMDSALQTLGADTDSLAYKGGKLATEVAGTLGVGGAAANTLARVPGVAAAAPNFLTAIRTAGMEAGPAAAGLQGFAQNALVRAAGGGINGALSAGLVDPKEAGTGAAVGAALPGALQVAGAVGKKAGSVLRGGGVSPDVTALAKRAEQLGIDIPADRLVNSKPLDAIASGLNYVPFSGRAATEKRMAEQLNQAASKLMGQNTPNINKALRDAGTDLGAKFDTTLRSTGVQFDQQLLNDLSTVYNQAERELGSDALKPIASQIDELVQKGSTGVIDGQAAYNIKRALDRIGRQNTPTAYHALELKGVLMDALDRSLGPDGAQAFSQTRQQYGNMLALEKLAKNGVDGEISVARLANLKNINNEPLQELADIAAQFVKAREGQHGAMQRAVVGLGAAATGGLPGLATGAVVGRTANTALNSNAMRSLVMGEPNALQLLANPELRQLGYRAAPVLGASR